MRRLDASRPSVSSVHQAVTGTQRAGQQLEVVGKQVGELGPAPVHTDVHHRPCGKGHPGGAEEEPEQPGESDPRQGADGRARAHEDDELAGTERDAGHLEPRRQALPAPPLEERFGGVGHAA